MNALGDIIGEFDVSHSQRTVLPNDIQSFCNQLLLGFEESGCRFEDGLLLAVSGGADSVALLHATRSLCNGNDHRIVVAHVDHSLRKDSGDDARFVVELSTEAGLHCEILTIPEGQLEGKSDGSLEESARKARYKLLASTAKQQQLRFVATAHHMDDQAETVLHNILRGTGLRGLRGMKRSRELDCEIHLIRPMLAINRSEILAFLADSNHTFRVDNSNDDISFTRNRIRNQLLPGLKRDFNVAADQHLVSLARQVEQTLMILDSLADQILAESTLERQCTVCRLERGKLCDWPVEIIRHTLTVLWIRQSWPRKKMTFDQWKHIAETIHDGADGQFDLPAGVKGAVSGNLVRFYLQQPA